MRGMKKGLSDPGEVDFEKEPHWQREERQRAEEGKRGREKDLVSPAPYIDASREAEKVLRRGAQDG